MYTINSFFDVYVKDSLEQKLYEGAKQFAQEQQASKGLLSNAIAFWMALTKI
ncbi:MAG: hypothetical protein BAJALOKI1v1_2150003 [Promethearchaeota archaeon]|nr:MAG: hypothetical protein BAJALOKI1v1_2150003 [Candidatus Lokiarchaeota archaeon]